jgi:uncharacterized protein YegP (UPF0339 family)
VADLTYPYFSLYKDTAGQWRWKIKAKNHKIIADSAEGYHNKQDAVNAIELVKGVTKVWDASTEKWL